MELNTEAWTRWTAYRTAIRKPIRSVSEEATKLKLMRFGEQQSAVVDQSIANGWQGLFAITPEKNDPSAPKKRTKEQSAADEAQWAYLNKQSQREWEKSPQTPITRLKLAAALLARYDVEPDQSALALSEKRSWLRDRTAELLREADPAAVLNDLECIRLVLRLFNSPGLHRLRYRAAHKEAA